jgi:hypothetical protein
MGNDRRQILKLVGELETADFNRAREITKTLNVLMISSNESLRAREVSKRTSLFKEELRNTMAKALDGLPDCDMADEIANDVITQMRKYKTKK